MAVPEMVEQRVERRLAAILVADMVGYSRQMAADEEGTVARLKALRAEVIDPKLAAFRGRIVKEIGDGLLVEFPSVVDAVNCAVEVQELLAEKETEESEDRRIMFRMGINLGDVIVEGDDIYGDGVNIAARLESLAEPKTICIAGKVYDEIKGKLDLSYEDLGERSVKNIAAPLRVYRIGIVGASDDNTPSTEAILDRPAIAVLPFVSLSGGAEQEYLADGLAEDIVTALSHWRSFPVISRSSTLTYKGQSVDVRKAATNLGARYVLQGSVRRGGDRVRITAQLIDARTGHHTWGEKFDRAIEDILELQDDITQRVAAAVAPEIDRAEQRLATKSTQSLSAWECYHRGMSYLHNVSKGDNIQARQMFQRAIELDPTYSDAFTGLAFTHHRDINLRVAEDPDITQRALLEAALQAVRHNPTSSSARAILAIGYQHTKELDLAIEEAGTAVSLNPSNALAYITQGVSLSLAGRSQEGIPQLKKALDLSPRDPWLYQYMTLLAQAYISDHDFQMAEKWARKAVLINQEYANAHFTLAICLGHLGRNDEARAELAACQRINPDYIDRRMSDDGLPPTKLILAGLRKTGWKGQD